MDLGLSVLIGAAVFVGVVATLMQCDRLWRLDARSYREWMRHAEVHRGSRQALQAIQLDELPPEFRRLVELMLSHDKQNRGFCLREAEQCRQRIPRILWRRYLGIAA